MQDGVRGSFHMSEPRQLVFHPDGEGSLLLPSHCSLTVSCYADQEVGEAVTAAMEQILYALALVGMDLRALDGITMSRDCRSDAMGLQRMPEGQAPLEIRDQPDTMEMARTVAVWREKELRFHIVLRSSVGLMTLSP